MHALRGALVWWRVPVLPRVAKASSARDQWGLPDGERSSHPTVKPVEVMRWLIRLVTPPGGTSWTCSRTGNYGDRRASEDFLEVPQGIEREPEYAAIAEARIEWWQANTDVGAPTDAAVLKVVRDPRLICCVEAA